MASLTALPCRGRIIEFTEDSGTILTEHETRVRFGRTSCSGFDPRVDLDVWVMATRMMSVVGERATLVNLTGVTESADPAERARQRRELEERRLREQHEATAKLKLTFYDRARTSDLPASWQPGLVALSETIELPPPLRALIALEERAGERVAARVARHAALTADIRTDAVLEHHRADDTELVMCFGPCVPWPIPDACLVPFAQIDGEEPNLFALFFHPDLYRARKVLPVVHWTHEGSTGFITDDAAMFIAAVSHGRFSHDGEIVGVRCDLARLTGLDDPIDRIDEQREFPSELMELIDGAAEERRASEALTSLSLGDDYAAVSDASEALELRYRELGWPYHVRHTQFQRLQYFEE